MEFSMHSVWRFYLITSTYVIHFLEIWNFYFQIVKKEKPIRKSIQKYKNIKQPVHPVLD